MRAARAAARPGWHSNLAGSRGRLPASTTMSPGAALAARPSSTVARVRRSPRSHRRMMSVIVTVRVDQA
jgi:hypothetical protein